MQVRINVRPSDVAFFSVRTHTTSHKMAQNLGKHFLTKVRIMNCRTPRDIHIQCRRIDLITLLGISISSGPSESSNLCQLRHSTHKKKKKKQNTNILYINVLLLKKHYEEPVPAVQWYDIVPTTQVDMIKLPGLATSRSPCFNLPSLVLEDKFQ